MAKKEFLAFTKAIKYIRKLNLKGKSDYHAWAKTKSRPENIPYNPQIFYKGKGWVDWGHFLGTGRRHVDFMSVLDFHSYEEVQSVVQKKNFRSRSDFRNWAKPKGIPAKPDRIYATRGWTSWGDFLGTGTVKTNDRQDKVYLSFTEARRLVRTLDLKNARDYFKWWAKIRPSYLPVTPQRAYKEWVDWYDFLGTLGIGSSRMSKHYLSFCDAKEKVQGLNLQSPKCYKAWWKLNKPKSLPSSPDRVYIQWISWDHFMGVKKAK